ncbi:hypothetical protein QU38_01340, partial [Staphylococcus aureus]
LEHRAGEFGEINADRCIGDALGEQRQHDQAGHDEAAIGHAFDRRDAAAHAAAEHDEIERGGDHRGDDRLPERAQRARHLELVDRPDAVEVDAGHAAAPSFDVSRCSTSPTKISSRLDLEVSRSLNAMPISPSLRSSEGMPVR